MPYISSIDRPGAMDSPRAAGALNYKITMELLDYIARRGGASYQNFNDVIGVLECCKLEMYRRMVAPYEDEKMALNGDVFP